MTKVEENYRQGGKDDVEAKPDLRPFAVILDSEF